MTISDREKLVLNAIIDYYLTYGETIGSRTLVKKYGIELSSATIRNVMADLEDMGFIEKTHTSSGRIPTDLGYKYYLDELLEIERLTFEEKQNIDMIYNRRVIELDNILEKTTNLLSKMTSYTSIVVEPKTTNDRLERIELIYIDEYLLMLIIIMEDRTIKTKKINMPYPILKEEVFNLNLEINKKLKENVISVSEIESFIVGNNIVEDEEKGEDDNFDKYFINNIVSMAKNTSVNEIYDVLEFFNKRNDTKLLINKLINQKRSEDKIVNIIFGEELGIKELENFSFVYSVYNIGDSEGIIGVIGPKRMAYSKTIGLIEHVTEELNHAIEQLELEK